MKKICAMYDTLLILGKKENIRGLDSSIRSKQNMRKAASECRIATVEKKLLCSLLVGMNVIFKIELLYFLL